MHYTNTLQYIPRYFQSFVNNFQHDNPTNRKSLTVYDCQKHINRFSVLNVNQQVLPVTTTTKHVFFKKYIHNKYNTSSKHKQGKYFPPFKYAHGSNNAHFLIPYIVSPHRKHNTAALAKTKTKSINQSINQSIITCRNHNKRQKGIR